MTETAPTTSVESATDQPATGDESCSCCDSTDAGTVGSSSVAAHASGITVATYAVTGMTCGHCVSAVSTEIAKLPGVTNVGVDLPSGAVTVTSAAPLTRSDVAAAVDEAGYELIGAEDDAGAGR